MAVNKIDPKVIFASEAPAQDTPAVFTNRTVGWGETRKNGGRPTIKQMNAEQQSTDLKILWLNENAVTPYDVSIDYPQNAVTIKDGEFKILNGGIWETFLDRNHSSLTNRDVASSHPASAISTANTQTQQGVNDSVGAKWYEKVGGYILDDRVMLDKGFIVKSTVTNNTVNPNVNMTGWEFSDASLSVESVADFFAATNLKVGVRYKCWSGEAWDVVNSGEDFVHPSGAKLKIVPRYGTATPSIEPQMINIKGDRTDEITKAELLIFIAKAKGWDVNFRKFRISISRTLIIEKLNNTNFYGESQYISGFEALEGFVCPDDSDLSVPTEHKVRSVVRIKNCAAQTWSNLNIDGNTQNNLYGFDLLRTDTSTQNTAAMSRNKFVRINGNSRKTSGFFLAGGFFVHDRDINPDNNAENTFSHCWFERCSKSFLTLRNRNSLDNLVDHCVFNNGVGAVGATFIETQAFTYNSTECGGGGFNVIGGYANVAGGITADNQANGCCLFKIRGQLLHDISLHGINVEDNCKLLDIDVTANDSVRAINLHSVFLKGGVNGAYGDLINVMKTGTKEVIVNLFGGAVGQGRTATSFNIGSGVTLNLHGHVLSASNINGTGEVNFFGSLQTPGTVTIASTVNIGSLHHKGKIVYGLNPEWDLSVNITRQKTIDRFTPLVNGEGMQLKSPDGIKNVHVRMLNEGNLAVGTAATYKTLLGSDGFVSGTASGSMAFMKVNIGGADRYIPFYNAIV